MLFLIDLDGTLVKTDHLHYVAWSRVLKLPIDYIKKVVTTHSIDHMLADYPNPSILRKLKVEEMLKFENIELMKNVEFFIDFIINNDIEHVVVTNTNRDVVDHFKYHLPILTKLKNWVVREDYIRSKPDPECYKLAISKYNENKDGIILGFENSKEGIKAVNEVTDDVFYINTNTDYLKILEDIKIQCQKKYGMHLINSKLMEKKR
tara:strand:+ start:8904 stop:9521 length:618 start_codon:yes stop_codon:yes gene_type:complete